MTHLRVYGHTCVFLLLTMVGAGAVKATTIVMPTDAQLIEKSPIIVKATVISSAPVDHNGGIWTETLLSIDQVIKGKVPASSVIVREVGGQIGERMNVVFGAAEYVAGEKVLAFLIPTPRGDHQTMDLFVGRFSLKFTSDRKALWHREAGLPGTYLLDRDFRPIQHTNVQRDAAGFERFIQQKVRNRPAIDNYGIENPTLESSGITANFTLISEPTLYRWSGFDSGTAAPWYHFGSQTGYTGGGVNELRTAMGSWTGYTSARVLYNYVAAGSGSPAGLSAVNGINEVVFNDLTNEISGSWNPSTGGVVGRGGFNNTTSGGAWTSPFTADSSHTARIYSSTWRILEGNLVIQNGVSPANGISSTRLAEILAHEFGHTLGLGHSSDSTALMYASVTGAGPSLRTDDQTAARWLYPSGTTCSVVSISVPGSVGIGASGMIANVAAQTGATYSWTVSGGTLQSGQGTNQILFAAGPAGTTMNVSVTRTASGCSAVSNSKKVQVDFTDVPPSYSLHDYVNTAARNGIMTSCSSGKFCPDSVVTRDYMAMFLLRSKYGSTYAPPSASGTIFSDVTASTFAASWIEKLYADQITSGCAAGRYCPTGSVTRAQMAIFLLRTKYGSSYAPPAAVGLFTDVPPGMFGASFIEQAYREGITTGCEAAKFCPAAATTRSQMAKFLTIAFGLQ